MVGLVSLARLYIAAHLPLTEDETYYWTWSRHLALGYLDHPPMVAWLIAASSWMGNSPLAVRLPFILCEAGAALAVGGAAVTLSGQARSGLVATAIFAFIPQPRMAIGEALPDAPYLLFCSISLWLAARAFNGAPRREYPLLGLALGGALLSRFFGWALLGGVAASALIPYDRRLWRRGFWIAFAVALLAYVPFLLWNASNGWENLAFTLGQRESPQSFSAYHVSVAATARYAVFAAIIFVVGYFTAIRRGYPLLAWTALPFTLLLVPLSFRAPVESYWLLGPFASLIVGVAMSFSKWSSAARAAGAAFWMAAGAYTFAGAIFSALPEGAQARLLEATHGGLKGPFYSAVYIYRPLARDLESLARENGAAIVTDRFEIASELSYNGVDSLIVGDAPQTTQWSRWYAMQPTAGRLLLVSFAPIDGNPRLRGELRGACRRVAAGPAPRYEFAGTRAGTFYATWCEGLNASRLPSLTVARHPP